MSDTDDESEGTVHTVFSIIVPTYNAEHTISQAVSSCLDQTYPHLEVIVVVNGTTDRTLSVLREIGDPRLTILEAAQRGRSKARNQGLNAAVGDFVIFLDADDTLDRQKLWHVQKVLMAADAVDAVQGGTRYRSQDGTESVVPATIERDVYRRLLVRNTIPIQSMAVRRTTCGTFPDGIEYCEDWMFWLDTLSGARVQTYPHIDSTVHLHDTNTSLDVERMRSYELIPRIEFWRFASASWYDRAKRTLLLIHAMVAYASLTPISKIDAHLEGHRTMLTCVTALRRSDLLQRTVKRAVQTLLRMAAK
jgi:glycosyltransferase involved in cell wall biosynthesis